MIKISQLPVIVKGKLLQLTTDHDIHYLITDSRKALASGKSLFFAIKGIRHDGHDHIRDAYDQGIRSFVVERPLSVRDYPLANFILVNSSISALQQIALYHRKEFSYPVIGITGSNGKTIVKEWLYQMVTAEYNCVKNPGSYNSQIGVPLSVWQMSEQNNLAIFEAGISQVGEMDSLAAIIQPTIGIFTNIGSAHDEGFASTEEKIREKLKLFLTCETVIYCSDYPQILALLMQEPQSSKKLISWGQNPTSNVLLEYTNIHSIKINGVFGEYTFEVPFLDKASRENVLHCIVTLLYLGYTSDIIQEKINELKIVPMRLQLKQGINQCQVVDDTYNNDVGGLRIGLEFLESLNQSKKTLIVSDILQSGLTLDQLSEQVASLVREKNIQKFIGIGFGFHSHQHPFENLSIEKKFYLTTDDFIREVDWSQFQNEAILIKGARVFAFEKIVQRLQKKIHGTVMEIDLGALVHNLNYFRSLLNPGVKVMVMVKAFAYGSGSKEVASLLQYHRVDYLGVAYADEGVTLREGHIRVPIMVMNPNEESFSTLLEYDLEPEIYSFTLLKAWADFLRGRPGTIHLKIDTGMHRLGFEQSEIPEAIQLLAGNPNIKVASLFSHLAGAEDIRHDQFSQTQASRFEAVANTIQKELEISPVRHLLNSSGILRHPGYQFDMVRLGIGLYGIDPSGSFQNKLKPVAVLKSVISQIKRVAKGDTIGYGRKGIAKKETTIATLAIGYADGYLRVFSNGVGEVSIRGKRAAVIGNVCMDMTMVDISDIPDAREGDEAVIFGQEVPLQELARKANTIAYEVLTNTSERVKRVFVTEGI